jgi:hypothetical protein
MMCIEQKRSELSYTIISLKIYVCLIRLLASIYKRKTSEELYVITHIRFCRVIWNCILLYYVKYTYYSLPGMSPQVLFGNLLQTGILWRDKTLPTVCQQFQSKFGDVFQFWLGSVCIIVVCSLDNVQHIFAHRHIYDQS